MCQVRCLLESRVAVLLTASSSRRCRFLARNRLQVPEEAQLPEGLKQNQSKHEERKNGQPGLGSRSRAMVLWKKRNRVSPEDISLHRLSLSHVTFSFPGPVHHRSILLMASLPPCPLVCLVCISSDWCSHNLDLHDRGRSYLLYHRKG